MNLEVKICLFTVDQADNAAFCQHKWNSLIDIYKEAQPLLQTQTGAKMLICQFLIFPRRTLDMWGDQCDAAKDTF